MLAPVDSGTDHPRKSKVSPWILVFMALTLIAIGVGAFFPLVDELKMGQASTVAVIFGSHTKVSKLSSPGAFWINIALQLLGCILGIVLGIGTLIETFANRRKQ